MIKTIRKRSKYEGGGLFYEPYPVIPLGRGCSMAVEAIECRPEKISDLVLRGTFTMQDVDYGVSNLSYLQREVDETGSLFRVFVPFTADNSNVKDSHEIALLRGLLEYGGESEVYNLSNQQFEMLNRLLSYDKIVKHF